MAENSFTPAFYNEICKQQDAGQICRICEKTEIEHTFAKSQTCPEFRGPDSLMESL